MGGSVLLHIILIKCLEGISHQALLQSTSEAAVPIDWVELPSSASTSSLIPSAAKPAATTPNTASDKAKIPAAKTSSKVENGIAVMAPPTQEAVSKPVKPSYEAPVGSAPSPSLATPEAIEPESPAASEDEVDSLPAPSPTSELDEPEAEEQALRQLQARQTETSPSQSEQSQASEAQLPVVKERPLPSSNPSPLIVTQQINVPVPDVTATLPVEADQPTEAIVEEIMVPSELTASLTTALPEANNLPLDEAAYPKQEVQTFTANSTSSPCVVSPEAVPFLGKTVAMEVMTNESGQVVDTVTQESSQNPAYDELATCLVKNWDFEPATAQGQPVATNGLVVRITIEADG